MAYNQWTTYENRQQQQQSGFPPPAVQQHSSNYGSTAAVQADLQNYRYTQQQHQLYEQQQQQPQQRQQPYQYRATLLALPNGQQQQALYDTTQPNTLQPTLQPYGTTASTATAYPSPPSEEEDDNETASPSSPQSDYSPANYPPTNYSPLSTKPPLPSTTLHQKPKYICLFPLCSGTSLFDRKADLERHVERLHNPKPKLYNCPIPGCDRREGRGLPRKDKLMEHLRERHKVDLPKIGEKGRGS